MGKTTNKLPILKNRCKNAGIHSQSGTVLKNERYGEVVYEPLEGIEITAINSVKLINQINFLMFKAKDKLSRELPKIHSKDLLESLFIKPYIKTVFLVKELGLTRKTAASYLRDIEKIGILKSIKVGRNVYFINKELFALLKNR